MTVLTPAAALAPAQPFEGQESLPAWTLDVGGGAVKGFSATGRGGDGYGATPLGLRNFRRASLGHGLDGLGWTVVAQDAPRAGVQLRLRYAAGEIEGSSLKRPGFGADIAVYAFHRLPGNLVVGGRLSQDVTGDDAGLQYYASIAHRRVTPLGLGTVSAYVTGGDSARNQRGFGVPVDQAPGIGFQAFEPGSGLSGAGVAVSVVAPLGSRLRIGGFLNYEERLGDSRDSPLIADRGLWRSGVILVYRFRAP